MLKARNNIQLILKGCGIIFISYILHSFFLSFVTYRLIDEKVIEGGMSRGYFEIVKLGFQYSQVTQWAVMALITLAAGFIFGSPKIVSGMAVLLRKHK